MTGWRLGWAERYGEPQVKAALESFGYTVAPYGQAMLTAQAREMLRNNPVPERWTPDFIVKRPPIYGRPRWPADRRDQYSFLVDAKYRFPNQHNYSIEMRSLVAGTRRFGMDVFYVCGTRHGNKVDDIGVIHHDHVTRDGRIRPCCSECWRTYNDDERDPMLALPDYCPNQRKSSTSSGTPYVVFGPEKLSPLSDFVFDNIAMAKMARELDLPPNMAYL